MELANLFLLFSSILLVVAFFNEKNSFPFTPLKLFVYVIFVYLLCPGFYFINYSLNGEYWKLHPEVILYQNVLIFFFIITFLVTYYSTRKIKVASFNKDFRGNIVSLVVILLLASIYSKYYLFKSGAFFLEDKYGVPTEIPRVITFLNNVHLWGYIIWFVYLFRITEGKVLKQSTLKHKIISVLYFVVTIGIPLLQGRRFGVIFPLLMLIALYSYYARIRFKELIKYFFYLLSVFASVTVLRLAQSISLSEESSSKFFDFLESVDPSLFSRLLEGVISRIGNVYIVFNTIIFFRNDGLNPSFNSFYLSFKGLIPSFIWKGKPDLSIGNTLGKELGLITWQNKSTGINAGWIGEGYYNYGTVGVILAAFFFAFTINFVWNLADQKFDTGKLIFLMTLIFLVSGFQMEIAMTFNNFLKGVLIQLILIYSFSLFSKMRLK